jgi:hypothetical protein
MSRALMRATAIPLAGGRLRAKGPAALCRPSRKIDLAASERETYWEDVAVSGLYKAVIAAV